MADRIDVKTPDGSYPILIEMGLVHNLTRAGLGDYKKPYLVTNTTLAPLYGERLSQRLSVTWTTIPDGEHFKTLDTTAELYRSFLAAGLDRNAVILALGGGVVGDTVGFAAATYMRGVRFIQLPTSLLAMVDSSVGGKVGVDLPEGKNLVGAFKQPEQVLIDPYLLSTLPEREWRGGMAEVIKHGLLADPALLELAPAYKDNINQVIRRAIQVKVELVQADPFEKGVRAHLNLGHTFGHAIEQVSGYQWSHGEAVGAGLVAAARLSQRLGLCDAALPALVEKIVGGVGLPTRIGNLDAQQVLLAMRSDKKWQYGKARFVLLEGVGKPTVVEGVLSPDVIAVLEGMRA